MALHCELDHALEELSVLDALGLPEVERERARDSVYLVDIDLVGVHIYHEVDTCNAVAAEVAERVDRGLSDELVLLGGYLSGDLALEGSHTLAAALAAADVLLLIAEDIVVACLNGLFADGCLRGLAVSEHGAVYLLEVCDAGLDEDTVSELESLLNGLDEAVPVLALGDADARAEVYGLDDDGVAELALDLSHHIVYLVEVERREAAAVEHGEARVLEQYLHDELIHSHSGRKHVAAYIGEVEGLEVALKRSVLDVSAVNDGESDIDVGDEVRAELLYLLADELYLALTADENALGALLEQSGDILEAVDVHELLARPEFAFLGHVDGDDVVLFLVHACHSLNCGDDRDLMLDASSAENYR